MSGFTKEIIAKTFTELLDEKPMSKITVKDIVERCGVNRNTFYYHFKDIPDVVEFILKKKWDGLTKNGGSGTMQVNWGGFALAPYLCREIVTFPVAPVAAPIWLLAPYLCREIVTTRECGG